MNVDNESKIIKVLTNFLNENKEYLITTNFFITSTDRSGDGSHSIPGNAIDIVPFDPTVGRNTKELYNRWIDVFWNFFPGRLFVVPFDKDIYPKKFNNLYYSFFESITWGAGVHFHLDLGELKSDQAGVRGFEFHEYDKNYNLINLRSVIIEKVNIQKPIEMYLLPSLLDIQGKNKNNHYIASIKNKENFVVIDKSIPDKKNFIDYIKEFFNYIARG